jgi:hypothetical protein
MAAFHGFRVSNHHNHDGMVVVLVQLEKGPDELRRDQQARYDRTMEVFGGKGGMSRNSEAPAR